MGPNRESQTLTPKPDTIRSSREAGRVPHERYDAARPGAECDPDADFGSPPADAVSGDTVEAEASQQKGEPAGESGKGGQDSLSHHHGVHLILERSHGDHEITVKPVKAVTSGWARRAAEPSTARTLRQMSGCICVSCPWATYKVGGAGAFNDSYAASFT